MQKKYLEKVVQGSDSSFSLYNDKYQQSYHSKSLGAYSETLLKHVFPSLFFYHIGPFSNAYVRQQFLESMTLLQQTSQAKPDIMIHFHDLLRRQNIKNNSIVYQCRPVRILDICFGLGYNAMLAIKCFPSCEIYSPEQDNILQDLQDFSYYNLAQSTEILESLTKKHCFRTKDSQLYFLHGNALSYLETFNDGFFDIVFQDAFSQLHNPELWSLSYFKKLYKLTAKSCIITTYAKAKSALNNAKNAGFEVLKYDLGSIFYKKTF